MVSICAAYCTKENAPEVYEGVSDDPIRVNAAMHPSHLTCPLSLPNKQMEKENRKKERSEIIMTP